MKFNFFRNFLAAVSLWTMVFSPVASGLQAKSQFNRITQDQIKSMLIDLGLNKKSTYGQFWDRTKHMYPAQVYAEVEAYFKTQPSTVMPAFEVTYTQNAKGEKVPTIKITDRGQTYNLEIIGELNEWARVNQVSLSESDLTRLKPAIEKLSPGSTKLETYRKDFARFEGFPRMTPQAWRTLKPEERAAYIVKMRLLWFEARRVIEANQPEARVLPLQKKPKKTSSYEELLKMVFGAEAQAAQTAAGRRTETERQNAGRKAKRESDFTRTELLLENNYGAPCKPDKAAFTGDGCIVAGHVSPANAYSLTYNSTSPTTLTCGCNYDTVVRQKAPVDSSNEGIGYKAQQEKLNAACAANSKYMTKTASIPNASQGQWIACQTDIYSFDPEDGSPFCIHTMSTSFQRATAFDTKGLKNATLETCDQQARLNKSEYNPLGTTAQNQARTEAEQADGDYLETKKYLDGMLKAKNMGVNVDLILAPRAKHAEAIDDFLVNTQKAFEREINSAIKLCMAGGSKHEPNHGAACEQLHRRWLFTEKFLAQYRQKACIDGSTYIGSYEKDEKIMSSKEVQLGSKKISKTALNKMTLAELKDQPVCKCEGRESKQVALGQKCTSGPDVVMRFKCPQGSVHALTDDQAKLAPEGANKCQCHIPNQLGTATSVAFDITGNAEEDAELYKKNCIVSVAPPPVVREPPAVTKRDCAKDFPGASPLDSDCYCTAGSRNGDYPKQINSAPIEDRASGTPDIAGSTTWTCDEKTNLWPLAAFAALALLMFKKKKDSPPTCTGLNQVLKMGYCVCKFSEPGVCPAGAKTDCSGCAAVPTCSPPVSAGTPPLCYCPNRDTCVGKNVLLQPSSCECQAVEGGTTPDTCIGADCSGGTPPVPTTGR